MNKLALTFALTACWSAMAQAQASDDPPPVEVRVVSGGVQGATTIAVPAMPAAPGASDALGRQIAEVISSDLRSTGAFTPLGPNGIGGYSVAQATAPAYGEWRGALPARLSQYPLIECADETAALGDLHEILRRKDPAAGVPPADQCLDTYNGAGFGIDLWLVGKK